MKRYFVILNLICLFALPFVSPYLFDRGIARNQTQSRVSFETHRGPKAHHATPSDNAEQNLNNFNNRFEAYFDELKQSPGAAACITYHPWSFNHYPTMSAATCFDGDP
ncbi:hypothetical protein QY895_03595 [Latilactobacillus sakei]